MSKTYDVIFVGFGPATIFSLLKFPQKNCLVIEKGKSLNTRDNKEVLFGSGGAGAFSDSKLVNNPIVGGDIKNIVNISDEEFYSLADDILNYYNHFNGNNTLRNGPNWSWIPEDNYEIPSDKLKLLKSKVSHVGTDNSKRVFQSIEEHLKENHQINFEEEVIEIKPFSEVHAYNKREQFFTIITNKGKYETKRVIIGVGKRSNLVENLKTELNLQSQNNLVQMGIRVECPNIYFKELISKFYDFKIVMKTPLGRWRTFCCCGKKAYVTVEKCKEFISCNGAAVEGDNGLINFGIMGELNLNWGTRKQIEVMQKVNNGTNKLLAQNIYDFIRGERSNELNFTTSLNSEDYRLDNIWKYYPVNVLTELRTFIEEIHKIEKFNGHFFAPEIKITNPLIKMSDKFEIYPGVHLIGDCSGYSRSIVQSGIIGMLVGKHLSGI